MRLSIGQNTSPPGNIQRYAKRFDLLELRAEKGRLPGVKALAEWRQSVPDEFVFSLILPQELSSLQAEPDERSIAAVVKLAEVLRAGWLLLRTPPSVTPTERSRRRVSELLALLPAGSWRRAWEPRGLWEPADALRVAGAAGASYVADVAQVEFELGELAYTRIRALGEARLSAGLAERVAERIAECDEAYVMLEGEGAARAAGAIRELLEGSNPVDNADLDDEGEPL